MPFDVGDKVVYPHHGAATIEKREKKEVFGKKQEYLVLRLAYGDLTLMVPADNAEEIGLRDVINDEEVEEVFAVLRKKEARMPTNWSRRFKNHVEKLKSGDIYQVAEVVRNLTIREKDKGLSAGEKRMLGKARQILVSELTFALKMDEETAEEKLDEVLGKGEPADRGSTTSRCRTAGPGRPRRPRRPRRKKAPAKAAAKAPAKARPRPRRRRRHRPKREEPAEGQIHRGSSRASSRRSLRGREGGSVFVEVTRLFTVVLLTAAGFMLGKDLAPEQRRALRHRRDARLPRRLPDRWSARPVPRTRSRRASNDGSSGSRSRRCSPAWSVAASAPCSVSRSRSRSRSRCARSRSRIGIGGLCVWFTMYIGFRVAAAQERRAVRDGRPVDASARARRARTTTPTGSSSTRPP